MALEVSTDQHKHRLDPSDSALCLWAVVQSPAASARPESRLEMRHHGPLCRAAEPPGVYQTHQATPTPRQEEPESAQVWYLEGQEQLIYTQGWEGLREGLARVGPFHLRPKVCSNRRKKAETGWPHEVLGSRQGCTLKLRG